MVYKLKFIKAQNVWFNSKTTIDKNADIVFYNQSDLNINKKFNVKPFVTLLVELNLDENNIFERFAKSVRYEINRAIQKDNLTINYYYKEFSETVLQQFINCYNDFAVEREKEKISGIEFEYYYKNNQLAITTISSNTDILIWHTYIIAEETARLKTSNSIFINQSNETKNLIGRANKLLHWKDILYFKNLNLKYYDFGGWYVGNDDKKLVGINKFKESFGGYKATSYNYVKLVSIKGKLFYLLLLIKKVLKK